MKTLEEFIQRLQNDAAFEREAQAFVTGESLMAFVEREGYGFTLEQLTQEFKQAAKSPAPAGDRAPPRASALAALPPRPGGPAVPRGKDNFTRESPEDAGPQPGRKTPSPGPAEESPDESSRETGGRHRGFSLQRLKSSLEKYPEAGGVSGPRS
jgi:hypothetical protein